ncbi:hypothetical protein KP509_38G037100 [Ceratopteris richardii]|nr:hypothetical protein KP509_38G037100 [Ceratopteris richardii]
MKISVESFHVLEKSMIGEKFPTKCMEKLWHGASWHWHFHLPDANECYRVSITSNHMSFSIEMLLKKKLMSWILCSSKALCELVTLSDNLGFHLRFLVCRIPSKHINRKHCLPVSLWILFEAQAMRDAKF